MTPIEKLCSYYFETKCFWVNFVNAALPARTQWVLAYHLGEMCWSPALGRISWCGVSLMPCQMSFPSWQSHPPPFQCSLLRQSFLPAGAGRFAMRAACPQSAFRFLCEDIHGWNSPPLLICLLFLEFPRRHLNCEAFVCGQCRVWVGCLATQIRETTGHGSWMFIDLVSIDFQVSGRGLCCLACVLEDYIRKRPMGQTFFFFFFFWEITQCHAWEHNLQSQTAWVRVSISSTTILWQWWRKSLGDNELIPLSLCIPYFLFLMWEWQ